MAARAFQQLQKESQHRSNVKTGSSDLSTSLVECFIETLPKRNNSHNIQPGFKPLSASDIKVLILENINESAVEVFEEQGNRVEYYKEALSENELLHKITDVHALCIGPKTKISANILENAKRLLVIGCFCISTSQVNLGHASHLGIAVFNSPFSNSRSVAELVIGNIIALARQIYDRSTELHNGIWNTVSDKTWQVRDKILGIIGYGHVGTQVSILAESLGMKIIYYDVQTVMSLGSARQVVTLEELLRESDFISLHIPESNETKNMISMKQFNAMKKGAYFINTAGGHNVDIPALIVAIKNKCVGGAALDVFPNEPVKNSINSFNKKLNVWASELVALDNVILTPHISGNTQEAQRIIGKEVSSLLVRYLSEGNSSGSVNFPEISLKSLDLGKQNLVRILYIHRNIPGALRRVNHILSSHNIEKQFFDSRGEISYLMTDIASTSQSEIYDVYDELSNTPAKILLRLLY